jgi:uncharacterized membrane protein YesL
MKEIINLLGAISTLVLLILFMEVMILQRKERPKYWAIIIVSALFCIIMYFFAQGQDIYSR